MYIIWALIGSILLISDIRKKNYFKLIFASSFLFCAIIAYKFPNNYIYQFIGFIVFSLINGFFIKTILKNEKIELQKIDKFNDIINKEAIVKKDIGKTLSIDGIGIISYNNELYKAKSVHDKEIKAGNKVKIISKENDILNVEVSE